jgi:hypothetical protein
MSISKKPDTSGRNNTANLPKVSGGDALHPSHINNLSDGVNRGRIGSVVGGLLKRDNGGTSIIIPPQTTEDFPFRVSVVSDGYFSIKTGAVFSKGSGTASIQQYFGGMSAETIYRGGEYALPEGSKSFWDTSVAVATSGVAGADKVVIPIGSTSVTRCVWMDLNPPTLKVTDAGAVTTQGIPIAYIFVGGAVAQIVSENIYPARQYPLQISLFNKDYASQDDKGNPTSVNGIFAKCSVGTVNDVVPCYSPSGIISDASNEMIVNDTGEIAFWLECRRVDGVKFPEDEFALTIKVYEQGTPPVSDDEYGYICMALANIEEEEGENKKIVYLHNLLTGSLRAEAHRKATSTGDKWDYFYYRV